MVSLRVFNAKRSQVVLVDNTSSDTIAQLYPRFLSAGINVITPNKKAFSSDLSLYEDILKSGMSSGAKFYNESTVGAGLPVISTLKDLVTTGDIVSDALAKGLCYKYFNRSPKSKVSSLER